MFQEAIVFNSDLSSWDIAKVTDLSQILSNAASFNQDLCNWSEKIDSKGYVSNYMFKGSNCTFQADPEEDRGGPFCASTCKTAAVVWSMVSRHCGVRHGTMHDHVAQWCSISSTVE